MPTVLNITDDDLNLPEFGLSVKAHESAEVTAETAEALKGHPHFDAVTSPPPDPVPVNTEAQTTEEVTD